MLALPWIRALWTAGWWPTNILVGFHLWWRSAVFLGIAHSARPMNHVRSVFHQMKFCLRNVQLVLGNAVVLAKVRWSNVGDVQPHYRFIAVE